MLQSHSGMVASMFRVNNLTKPAFVIGLRQFSLSLLCGLAQFASASQPFELK